MPPIIINRLRGATTALHGRLDAGVMLIERAACLEGRRELATAFWRLHRTGEQRVEQWTDDPAWVATGFSARSPLIAADLADLKVLPPAVEPGGRAASLGGALGWAYVLEGSALGGKQIMKSLRGSGNSLTGLRFLDPYGEAAGDHWRRLVAALDDATRSGRALSNEVIDGAIEGFERAGDLLVKGVANV